MADFTSSSPASPTNKSKDAIIDAAADGDAADNDNASDGDEDGVEMTVEQFRALMKRRADDAPHLAAIDALVRRRVDAPGALPVALAPELLLSDWAGVADAAALRRDLGVTHVFSCIEGTYLSRDDAIAKYAAAGIAYDGVRADDDDAYPMLRRHFERFLAFVEPLRGARGGAAARGGRRRRARRRWRWRWRWRARRRAWSCPPGACQARPSAASPSTRSSSRWT